MEKEIQSVHAFKDFLESLMSLNIMKEATARNLKNSSARLLTVVKENEMGDVTKLDVNELAERYVNATEPKPSDSSITAYKSRMESAIKKFIAFQAGEEIPYNPIDRQEEEEELVEVKHHAEVKSAAPSSYSLPVVIRPESGTTVTISGIPTDLTSEEAERISSILKVYVRPQ
jgi:site-specific recombinase XerD